MPGGGTAPNVLAFPNLTAQTWSALMTGQDPNLLGGTADYSAQKLNFAALDTSHVLMDELAAVLDGANPFEDVDAIDPEEAIELIQQQRDQLLNLIAGIDLDNPSGFITTLSAAAETDVDAHIMDPADTVTAFADRRRDELANLTSSILAGYWMANASVGTQMGCALSNAVSRYEKEVASYDASLSDRRATLILQETDMMQRMALNLIQVATQAVHVVQETGRFEITAKQDQMNIDLGNLVKATQWRMDQYHYGFQGIAALGGAVVVPRAQSQGERILGAVTNAVSTGLSTGAMTGNPMIGLAAAGGSLAFNGLGAAIDAATMR